MPVLVCVQSTLDEKKRAVDAAKGDVQHAQQEHTRKASEARKAAAHLEAGKDGVRSAAAQAAWDAMPSTLMGIESRLVSRGGRPAPPRP